MRRRRQAGPGGSPPGPAARPPHVAPAVPGHLRHPWRAPALQAVVLVGVLASALTVRSLAAQDVQADRGVGPVVPTAVVVRAAAPPVSLVVPRLRLDTRLIGLRKDAAGRLAVPPDPQQAGWYSQGPAPGDRGPAVITGHVDSYRGPGVFFELRTMKTGDAIGVRRADGTRVDYTVTKVATYPKRKFPTAEVYGGSTPGLRLITCGGTFDRRARSYLSNIVVYASPQAAARPVAKAPVTQKAARTAS